MAGIALWWWLGAAGRDSPDQLLAEARLQRRQGHHSQAESLAFRDWQLDPQLHDAVLQAGECAFAQKEWTRALEHFD